MTVKVLIVDDSALVRQTLSQRLGRDPEIEVVDTATDPFDARNKMMKLKPDVLTLDVEMPKMNGIDFLRKLMKHKPMPVIIVSSLAKEGTDVAMDALKLGAVDVMCKPGSIASLGELSIELIEKIKAAKRANIKQLMGNRLASDANITPLAKTGKKYKKTLLIGGSTGAPEIVDMICRSLPGDCPGTVIALHMPPVFTQRFANRLNGVCDPEIKEAADGDEILPGRVLIAPGGKHTLVTKAGAKRLVIVKDGPLIRFHRPSIDALFRSGRDSLGSDIVAVLLTGMGKDGAQGIKLIKDKGCYTIAQDEASCVVFGMPKVAIDMGGISEVVKADEIVKRTLEII